MKKINTWFSLIEIIISTVILTIWIFWIYKLIGNNMAMLGNTQQRTTMKTLETNMRECINYFSFDSFNNYDTWSHFSIHFWNDNLWCFMGSYNKDYYFTWVTIDNNDFYLYGNIIEKSSSKINFKLNVFSPEVGNLYKENINFILEKKE